MSTKQQEPKQIVYHLSDIQNIIENYNRDTSDYIVKKFQMRIFIVKSI